MNIVFLDRMSIGSDLDLSEFDALGEMTMYEFSTPEEVRERVTDADIIIVNKAPVNEETIGTARHLKLVCVTATGTNNLDKESLSECPRDRMAERGGLFDGVGRAAYLRAALLSVGASAVL